jgi:diacylglycerol kinase family enzyme
VTPPPTHLLVANPTAQSGKNADRIALARELLAGAGVVCDFLPTEPEGRTVEVVRARLEARPYRAIISMGGDGTFREVAHGLLECSRREEIALSMLPTGTANDQGRSFDLDSSPMSLQENVDVIVRGLETRLDAGRIAALAPDGSPVTESVFFDSAGWGISARILATRNADRRKVEELGPLKYVYRDYLVYVGAALKTFLESYVVSDKFRAVVVADGEEHVLDGLTDLIVKGTRNYGGAWVFDKTSRHDDGVFEIVPFHGKRDWTSKAIVDLEGNPVTEEMLNEIGVQHSKLFRGGSIELSFELPADGPPLAAQIDGEEFPATLRARIQVLPRALRLIVPEAHAD